MEHLNNASTLVLSFVCQMVETIGNKSRSSASSQSKRSVELGHVSVFSNKRALIATGCN